MNRVWRHKKRQSVYTIIGEVDGFVCYVSHADGRLWCRPPLEFYDGRFEPVSQSTAPLTLAEMGFERG